MMNLRGATMDYERLDRLALAIRTTGEEGSIGVLSTGERLYVAMAANRPDLLAGYTMVQAFARLEEQDTQQLIERWRYR